MCLTLVLNVGCVHAPEIQDVSWHCEPYLVVVSDLEDHMFLVYHEDRW